MAAAEYYFGTQGALNQNRPAQYASQPQYQHHLQPAPPQNQQLQHFNPPPPPSYQQSFQQPPPPQQPYWPQSQQNQIPSNGRPASAAPYPTTPPMGPQTYAGRPQPPPQQSGYLGVPIKPTRSHSQPPRVHFAENKHDSDDSTFESESDSDASRRRHRRHRHSHSHSYDRSRSRDRDADRGYDDYSDRESSRHKGHKDHKDRDTFLGAGGGAIIGDVIFPGLGTAAGLLLGGYGGRKHAKAKSSRSRSEASVDREEYHSGRHNGGKSGWDADSATFKTGWAVR